MKRKTEVLFDSHDFVLPRCKSYGPACRLLTARSDRAVNRAQALLPAAAKRAERLINPIGGEFLSEHSVTSAEPGELSNAVNVALAAYTKGEYVDPSLRAQLILLGAAALSDMPDEMTPTPLTWRGSSSVRKSWGDPNAPSI